MCQVVIPIGNPPHKGKCEICGVSTQSWEKRWIILCPKHWLEVLARGRF